jgi:hypothetical protein
MVSVVFASTASHGLLDAMTTGGIVAAPAVEWTYRPFWFPIRLSVSSVQPLPNLALGTPCPGLGACVDLAAGGHPGGNRDLGPQGRPPRMRNFRPDGQ